MRLWIVAGAAAVSFALAVSAHRVGAQFPGETTSGKAAGNSIALPSGYRDWALISVAAVGPPLHDIRAKLGNAIAISDLRHGTIPYRDGAIIARLAWKQTMDPQTSSAFKLVGQQAGLSPDAIAKLLSRSFVAGPATNVQLMVKESKEYASTGGWGFAQFTNGKPDAIVQHNCFACHEPAKATDFVFTHYSP
jgi:hypothetical protein